MITLDGYNYETHLTAYAHKQHKLASFERGQTGLPLRTESGRFQDEFEITLVCDTSNVSTLRASFEKVVTLNFVDEEGVTWSPSAGSNDATHHYGTGVYFAPYGEPKPLAPTGWTAGNRFLVSITLLTKEYVVMDSGYLLTEASDYLTTEAGERLLWESTS